WDRVFFFTARKRKEEGRDGENDAPGRVRFITHASPPMAAKRRGTHRGGAHQCPHCVVRGRTSASGRGVHSTSCARSTGQQLSFGVSQRCGPRGTDVLR